MRPVAMIHPDDLMDRARRGALAPDEWQRLGAHLAACSACAWERAATDDFARERAHSDERENDASLDGKVDAALNRVPLFAAVEQKPGRPVSSGRLSRWAGLAMVAAGIAATLLPAARGSRDRADDDTARSLTAASTEASLDAGALGTPSGGDT